MNLKMNNFLSPIYTGATCRKDQVQFGLKLF